MTDSLNAYRRAFAQSRFTTVRNQQQSLKQTLQQLASSVGEHEQSDVYGSGQLIEDFEQEVASLLGKEAALFMVSGTQAQPVALKIWSEVKGLPYIAMHATSHLQLHEQNGFQALYGLQGITLGQPHCVPTLADLKTAARTPLAAVLLELPMREIGGQLPTWDALVEQSQWARENDIRLHMDGARLWQCPAAYNKSLAEICTLFDSVYVSFYKDLGGISGAVLAGDKTFIETAKVWQRRAGGNLFSLAPYIIAARDGLARHLPDMTERRDHASWLARQFNALPGFSTWPKEPHTSMFRMRIECDPEVFLQKAASWSEENDIALFTPPYLVGEDHMMCELSLGSAFSQKTKAQWQQAIAAFTSYMSDS